MPCLSPVPPVLPQCAGSWRIAVLATNRLSKVRRFSIVGKLRIGIDEGAVLNPIAIILLVLLILSGIGLIIFILLHSGKGTGISDAIASSVYSTQTGTSIVEKNLDRITIALVIVFMVSLVLLMIFYPQGSITAGQ